MCFPPLKTTRSAPWADKPAKILPGWQFCARVYDDRDPFTGGYIRDPVDGQAAVGDPGQVKHGGGLLVDGPLQLIGECGVVVTDLLDPCSRRSQCMVIIVAVSPLYDHFVFHPRRVGQAIHLFGVEARHTGGHGQGESRRRA